MRNRRLMVPRVDWADVLAGVKTEFRHYGGTTVERNAAVGWSLPEPVVLYCPNDLSEDIDTALGTLEAAWTEPMGAISEESLRREGFGESLTDFRRYIAERYPRAGFRPMARCRCFRVHPLTAEEREAFKDKLWHRMYGQFA